MTLGQKASLGPGRVVLGFAAVIGGLAGMALLQTFTVPIVKA